MASTLVTIGAILWWMLLGAAVTLAIVVWRGMRIREQAPEADSNPFGAWLGKPCWVRDRHHGGEWRKFRIVAVSHKGAVNVRPWDGGMSKAFWIPADKTPERVRLVEPTFCEGEAK